MAGPIAQHWLFTKVLCSDEFCVILSCRVFCDVLKAGGGSVECCEKKWSMKCLYSGYVHEAGGWGGVVVWCGHPPEG